MEWNITSLRQFAVCEVTIHTLKNSTFIIQFPARQFGNSGN